MRVVNQNYKVIIMNYRVDKVSKAIIINSYNKAHLKKLRQNNQYYHNKISQLSKRKLVG